MTKPRDPMIELLQAFGSRDLPFPYIPASSFSSLGAPAASTLATFDVDAMELYLFHPWVDRLLGSETETRFAVSFAGHGLFSYAWTVLLQRPGLRLLAQTGFGGVDADAAQDRQRLGELFDLVRGIDGDVPELRQDVVVLSSDFRGVGQTALAPQGGVDLSGWWETASTGHPLLAIDDIWHRRVAWPPRPDARAAAPADRADVRQRQAAVAHAWAQHFPEAADGDVDDPRADLALAQAMSPWRDPAQPHAWLPAVLDEPECWWCLGLAEDPIHRM